MSDVMRMELKQFGIDVIVIEPGAIKTPLLEEVVLSLLSVSGNGIYGKPANKLADTMRKLDTIATPPKDIAYLITKAIQAKKPKTRYVIGKRAKTFLFFRKFLSDRFFDKVILREFFN